MNKEAKIGFAIILVLLGIFVTVLAKKVYNSYAADLFVAAENSGEETADEPDNADQEQPFQSDKLESAFAFDAQPTVVAAINDSDKALPNSALDENVSVAAAESLATNPSSDSMSDFDPPPENLFGSPNTDADNSALMSYRDHSGKNNSADIFSGADSADNSKDAKHDYNRMLSKMTRQYAVNEDETLFDIARCELGKASRWVEIYNLNIDVLGKDMDFVTPGTLIILPDDDAEQPGALTRRPRMGSLR